MKVKKFVIFGDEEFDVVDNNNLKRNGVSSIDDIINKGVVGLVVISIFELWSATIHVPDFIIEFVIFKCDPLVHLISQFLPITHF